MNNWLVIRGLRITVFSYYQGVTLPILRKSRRPSILVENQKFGSPGSPNG